MTTTREDREAALAIVEQRMQFSAIVSHMLCGWVDDGRFRDGVHQMVAEDLDAIAERFAAHRQAAVRAERASALTTLSLTPAERLTVAAVVRILRGHRFAIAVHPESIEKWADGIVRGEPCNK